MTDKKGLLDDVLKVAKASAEELLDRGKAVAHDLAAKVGDEEGNAKDRAEAAAARARADAKRTEYEADMKGLDAKLNQSLDKARAQAAPMLDKAKETAAKAKAEAAEAIDRAKDKAVSTADKAEDAAARAKADLNK